uniref:Uncharacterized protein n=1 Tax=Cyclopterus lumpus TaxID=8103 RepID=A0A8C2XEV2_CYCLU
MKTKSSTFLITVQILFLMESLLLPPLILCIHREASWVVVWILFLYIINSAALDFMSQTRWHPGRRHPGRRHPGRRHPGRRKHGRRHPGRRHPGTRHPGRRHPGRRHPGRRHSGIQQHGRHQNDRWHPGRRHPGRRHPGRRHPGRRKHGRRHPGRRHPGTRHPGRRQHPGRRHPGASSKPNLDSHFTDCDFAVLQASLLFFFSFLVTHLNAEEPNDRSEPSESMVAGASTCDVLKS